MKHRFQKVEEIDIPEAEDHKVPSFPHNMDPGMDLLYKPARITRTLEIFFYFKPQYN